MNTIEAMKQALEALEQLQGGCTDSDDGTVEAITVWCPEVITALRAAIEQAEKQEPHSLLCVCGAEWDIYPDGKEVLASTAPRQWQGLTDEEIYDCLQERNREKPSKLVRMIAKAIEEKLMEKNG